MQRWRPTIIRPPLGLTLLALFAACDRPAPAPPASARAPLPAAADSLAAAGGGGAGRTGGPGSGESPPTVIAALGRAADSADLAPLTLTLADIGHRNGVTLYGTRDEAVLALPVNGGLVARDLQLRILPTPGMPAGTLVLRQRERILAMRPLGDTTTQLVLPLAGAVVEQGKATITLALSIPGRDACEAQAYYRTVLLPESGIGYDGRAAHTTSVNDFFPAWLRRVTFYVAEQPSLDAAQAALDAAAFIGRRYRGMGTIYEVKPLPDSGGALLEPGPWDRALIWAPGTTTQVVRPDSGRGSVLQLAGRRDARQLFTLADGADLVAADGFRATIVDLRHNLSDSASVRTLGDLGFATRTIEGSSLLVAGYPFALADFGQAAAPTSFRLVARHTPLPAGGHGSIRLHLNGALIWSKAIDRTDLDVVVPIPGHLLQRDNVLEVRYQVVLGEGACRFGGAVFTATIDAASAFVTGPGDVVAPGFARFPAAFVPAFSVLLDPVDRFRVDLAAQVVGAMQQTTRTPLAPAVARDRASATGPLLAIGTSPLAGSLGAPLHSDGFTLRDRTGKAWDDFAPTTPYAAMQGFVHEGNDVLLLHHTLTDGQPLAALVREALAPYGWFGMRGDVAVRGVAGPVRMVSAANTDWRIDERPGAPRAWYARYYRPLLAVLFVVLIGLIIWSYPRLVRRELDPAG